MIINYKIVIASKDQLIRSLNKKTIAIFLHLKEINWEYSI